MTLTHELDRATWSTYFDAVSERMFNLPASIELTGAGTPRRVAASRVALQALTYDAREDVFEAAVARGGSPVRSVLRRMITHPERIIIDGPPDMPPTRITVDADGVRTVIRVGWHADFAG